MFHGLSHVDLAVTNLARARAFYVGVLGFPVKREGEGFVDVDAHSGSLRLLETRRVEHKAALRVAVGDVEQAWKRLVEAGARPLYEPMRTPHLELLGSVADPDGHTITVWRELSEDEYGFVPELPKAQRWDPEAEALLKSLLLRVPALFRGLARRKVVREVETLAAGRDVGREDVIRGYIRGNSRPTRKLRVRPPLLEHGIDPERYAEDFEA